MLRSRFRDIQGYVQDSGTSNVTFKVHGHSRLCSNFRDIQGYVQDSGTIEVTFNGTFTKWYWSGTGRDRINSESEIGTRHGVW